ncbi:MAG: thioredoxin domain-containing protein [Pyrinomonadaceae bacterium]
MTSKFENRLAAESSPYLLQHKHNPVDWFPWCDEAFEKARLEDKPVLLSIGYSSCHWCHVMAHESFEDQATAELMNERFVNIKVDMEERPDIDKIYMNFVQITTGSGGWPLTVFLTPDQRPFFGGTYFPPTPRYNMPSFSQILTGVSDSYADRRDEILHSANDLVGELRRIGLAESMPSTLDADLLEHALAALKRTFDRTNGGFGGAPKFPAPMALEFLLLRHLADGDDAALEIVEFTARKMAEGGIFDQVGGGFHRYAVDGIWLVPHFEKMLYDNAQLALLYVRLFQITKDSFYESVARRTLDYVMREMTHEDGGFFSAQDADSEGVEGKFFVWDAAELSELLSEEEYEAFAKRFGITENGNFEGANIPFVNQSIENVAESIGKTSEETEELMDVILEKLFDRRETRIKPFRDEKVLTAWNGLMLTAFAAAAGAFEDESYLDVAEKNAGFLGASLVSKNGTVFRTWKDGEAKIAGYLEDYANLANGLLELHRISGNSEYFEMSRRIVDEMIRRFWDFEAGGFYFTSEGHENLLVRTKDYFDNATPSGNSAAFDALLAIAALTGEEQYRKYAGAGLRQSASHIRRYPGGFGRTLSVLEKFFAPTTEIVLDGDTEGEMFGYLRRTFLPFAVIWKIAGNEPDGFPLTAGRSGNGVDTAWVCKNFVCGMPSRSIDELVASLK